MRHRSRFASAVRRSVLAVGVLALGAAGVNSAGAVPAPQVGATKIDSHEHPTIDTYQRWNGGDFIWAFGAPDTATYGQVIAVPANKGTLWRFSFYMSNVESSGSIVARGEVYEWDGAKATGPALWESSPRTISYDDDGAYHRESFNPHGVPVRVGASYVLFVSVSRDYEECTSGYTLKWAYRSGNPYRAGQFVYLNNGGDESAWTNVAWDKFHRSPDTALKVHLR